jgi:tRNA(Ile)-lysidine synthase
LCGDAEPAQIFRRAVIGLSNGAADRDDYRLGLAVSGGPDSLAMLLLAHDAFPGKIMAATVDHQLRAEAADEARYVGEICAKYGIPHAILTPPEPIAGNIQSAARMARYALLDTWAKQQQCANLATAHHADDQLETVLMRLARGSGVAGLSGVRRVNGAIIRPCLSFTKAQLIEICEQAGIAPVQDPSNANADFDRVRFRQWLNKGDIPMDPAAAVRSADALAHADEALDWMCDILMQQRASRSADAIVLDVSGAGKAAFPYEVKWRLLNGALRQMDPMIKPRGETIAAALVSLQSGQTITIGNILCKGGDVWQFSPAPKRRG